MKNVLNFALLYHYTCSFSVISFIFEMGERVSNTVIDLMLSLDMLI
jgi:hypothetical protein